MKVDKQRRLRIPNCLVKDIVFKTGIWCLCDEGGKLYITREEEKEKKVVAKVNMDDHSRICMPKYLNCYVDITKEITVYKQYGKIWIENYERVAK